MSCIVIFTIVIISLSNRMKKKITDLPFPFAFFLLLLFVCGAVFWFSVFFFLVYLFVFFFTMYLSLGNSGFSMCPLHKSLM